MAYADSVDKLFDKRIEDHSKFDYNFPKGTYYKFDLKKQSTKWGNINQQLLKLSEMRIGFTDAWYQRRSSSCRESLWTIGDELIIRLNYPSKKVLKVGYKDHDGRAFTCGYDIVHYQKKVNMNSQ